MNNAKAKKSKANPKTTGRASHYRSHGSGGSDSAADHHFSTWTSGGQRYAIRTDPSRMLNSSIQQRKNLHGSPIQAFRHIRRPDRIARQRGFSIGRLNGYTPSTCRHCLGSKYFILVPRFSYITVSRRRATPRPIFQGATVCPVVECSEATSITSCISRNQSDILFNPSYVGHHFFHNVFK